MAAQGLSHIPHTTFTLNKYHKQSSSKCFHPTRLATTLTSSSPPLPSSIGNRSGPQEGFIVLETNHRIYTYTGSKRLSCTKHVRLLNSIGLTDNPLQIAILNLFVALKYRFPNLVVGAITRDSVKNALLNGISADQLGLFD